MPALRCRCPSSATCDPASVELAGATKLGNHVRFVTMDQIEQVPATDWAKWVEDNDAVLLDVREPKEWELGTLPAAQLLSIGEIVERIDEIPQDQPVLCICRGGERSAQVAMFLAHKGYTVANLNGGMHALGMQR